MNTFSEAFLSEKGRWPLALLGVVLILLAARLGFYSKGLKSRYPLPPGPKGSPIIGNLRQVPTERPDVQFARWSKEYSEFV